MASTHGCWPGTEAAVMPSCSCCMVPSFSKFMYRQQGGTWRSVFGRTGFLHGFGGHMVVSSPKVSCRSRRSCSCSAYSSVMAGGGFKREQVEMLRTVTISDDDIDMEESDGQGLSSSIEDDTLRMLEWPLISAQVAMFASTSMGMAVASGGQLYIGKTREESEELLKQTAAAQSLASPLDFSGVEDVRKIVADALSGNVIRAQDLCRVKGSLGAARRLYNIILNQTEVFAPLQNIIARCNLCTDLEEDIGFCIDSAFATVLDQASENLAAARCSRQNNMRSLESRLRETASRVVEAGGMDTPLVTRRRARLCIAVRASQKSLLPGGIVLDVSNTGATLFMEPEFAVALNNAEMQLAAIEEAEINAVLQRLTRELIDRAEDVVHLLESIVLLDLACARAAHATWLGAAQPVFCDGHNLSQTGGRQGLKSQMHLIQVFAVRHPLLLGAALPKLVRSGDSKGAKQKLGHDPAEARDVSKVDLPVPIDILVKPQVKVVTITGPNTGGKTAALKTLGVVALMAKAGLFLPAAEKPRLPWFKNVLADIGDDQSLERSLSTFSGHIQRICKLLDAGDEDTLVLLDEVGGGTDPSEGAALATAILRHLASSVCFTLATTHSAELRLLKSEDSRFENASVEFDIKTLSPTYRVLWGLAGQSNALNIAASLRFDAAIIKRAQILVKKLAPSKLGVRTNEVMVPLLKQLDEQCQLTKAAADELAESRLSHSQLAVELEELTKREAALKQSEVATINKRIADGKARMDSVVSRYQQSFTSNLTEDMVSMREAQNAIAQIAADLTAEFERESETEASGKSVETKVPVVGSKVFVRRLGKVPATVIEASPSSGNITVQLGRMKLSVRRNEVSYDSGSVSAPPSTLVKQNKSPKREYNKSPDRQDSRNDGKYEVVLQTSKNTLDLRGLQVDDAVRELNLALASRAPFSVLFVIHGIGTGALKEAVWQVLQRHAYVAKYEEESTLNAGCTVVYIK